MSSTEPYPEANLDESGNDSRQTQQQQLGPEWPKKIRTLTATELDRLTIDGSGRFYWDGKLVNYEPPMAAKPEKSESSSRVADLDHDPYSFDETRSSEHAETDDVDHTDDAPIHPVAHREDRFHELDDVRAVSHRAVHHHDMGAEMSEAYAAAAPTIQIPDRIRVTMTRWQALGAIIVVLCLMVGALGLAAFGFIAVHDWGCRGGLFQSNCPAAPGGRPGMRTDIPA